MKATKTHIYCSNKQNHIALNTPLIIPIIQLYIQLYFLTSQEHVFIFISSICVFFNLHNYLSASIQPYWMNVLHQTFPFQKFRFFFFKSGAQSKLTLWKRFVNADISRWSYGFKIKYPPPAQEHPWPSVSTVTSGCATYFWRWSLVGGSRPLSDIPQRLYLVPSPFLFLSILTARRYRASFFRIPTTMMSCPSTWDQATMDESFSNHEQNISSSLCYFR